MTIRRPLLALSAIALLLPAGVSRVASAAEPPLIQPDELVKILRSTAGPRPLVLQVGFYVLYLQAHVPGAEYVGPASSPDGIQKLRQRVEKLKRSTPIVIYCGCCPWYQCPVIHPAYDTLHGMGFTNVKALYIPRNFGVDWLQRGYPVTRGQ